jgi:hypothetical protein
MTLSRSSKSRFGLVFDGGNRDLYGINRRRTAAVEFHHGALWVFATENCEKLIIPTARHFQGHFDCRGHTSPSFPKRRYEQRSDAIQVSVLAITGNRLRIIRVAHRQRVNERVDLSTLTVEEVDDVFAAIEDVFVRYYGLLQGSALIGLEPLDQIC